MSKRDSEVELKPCPFCGGNSVYLNSNTWSSYVMCDYCDADGPVQESDDQAISAWNSRTGDTK